MSYRKPSPAELQKRDIGQHLHLERLLADIRACKKAGKPYILKNVTEDQVLDEMEKLWHSLGPDGQKALEKARKRKAQDKIDQRRARQECSDCGYTRICGQGFTDYTCAGCGIVESYANTCVPKFCRKCSTTGKMCCRCGGPMD